MSSNPTSNSTEQILHNIKNDLNVIKGNASFLKKHVSKNPQLDDSVNDIKMATQNLQEKIEDLTTQLDQFKTITENTPALIAYINTEEKYQYVNNAYLKTFEIEKQNIIGKTINTFIKKDAYQKASPYFKRVLQGEFVEFKNELIQTPSGIKTLLIKLTPHFKNKKVQGFTSLITDISKKEKETKELQKNFSFLSTLTDNMPSFIAYLNKNQKYEFANEPYVKLFNHTKESIIGLELESVIGKKMYKKIDANIKKVLSGQTLEFENTLEKKEKTITLSIKYIPIFNNNNVDGFLALIHDITQNKKDQETLKKLHEYLDTILFNLPIGISILEGQNFKFFRINKALAIINNIPVENHLNKPFKEVLPHLEGFLPLFNQVITSGTPLLNQEFSTEFPKGSGKISHFLYSIFPIKVNGKIKAVGNTVLDITTQKNLESELIKSKEKAETANLAKTQFLANMSHEIRTPLGAISGLIFQLLKDMKTSCSSCSIAKSSDMPSTLASIKQASNTLTQTVNHILDLSKIESGKHKVNQDIIPIQSWCKDLISIHIGLTKEKNISLQCNCNDFSEKSMVSDSILLTQIFINLLSNAIKFSYPQTIIQIHLSNPTPSKFQITITNQGELIPKNKLSTIFNVFEQVDNTNARKNSGTGLGLAICKKNATLLKGSLKVKSTIKNGTTFILTLPYKKATHSQKKATNSNPSFMKNKHVLLVEDDPLNQNMMKKIFNAHNIAFELASNGPEAIEKTKNNPAIILMDIHMPRMNGIEATQEILKSKNETPPPIYALSADIFIEEHNNKSLFDGFISKPIDFDYLLTILAQHLS